MKKSKQRIFYNGMFGIIRTINNQSCLNPNRTSSQKGFNFCNINEHLIFQSFYLVLTTLTQRL
jgi:hypothetical protein